MQTRYTNAPALHRAILTAAAIAPSKYDSSPRADYDYAKAYAATRDFPYGYGPESCNEGEAWHGVTAMQAAACSEISYHLPDQYRTFKMARLADGGAPSFKLQYTRERLTEFAAKVARAPRLFGGGKVDTGKAKKAPSVWSAGAAKLVIEAIEGRDYTGALSLASEKCGPLFYDHGKGPFMLVCPEPVEFSESFVVARHEKGHYSVFEVGSGHSVGNRFKTVRSKGAAIARAANDWQNLFCEDEKANALLRCKVIAQDQTAMRAAWMAAHDITDIEAMEHRADTVNQEQAAQALEFLQAMAADNVAREATQADDVRELETVGACETNSEATTQASAAPGMGAAIAQAGRDLARRTLRGNSTSWSAQLETNAAGLYALRFTCADGSTDKSEHTTRRRRAQYLRELVRLNADDVAGYDDTSERTPGARSVAGADGWRAALTTDGGLYVLEFTSKAGGWTPTTTHATRRERAQVLRVRIFNDKGCAWLPVNVRGVDADTPREAQSLTDAQYRAAVATLEETNNHGAVVLLGALRTGNPVFINQARAINAQHQREGSLSPDLYQQRSELAQRVRAWLENTQAAPVDNVPAPCHAPAVDNPETATTAQAAPVADADYTAPRETSETDELHDSPRDLEESAEFVGRGTYSPEDNKLRLHPFARLDAATYARVKAAGYAWAPKQGFFVAPAWSPARADVLAALCGEIEDEDSTMAERAEVRADRFEEYQGKRAQDAARAVDAVHAIGARFELGQPILIGHHSERRARKDKEKMDNGMRRAVQMWDTSAYWEARARAALGHAAYKERPDVRARRIKTLEAEQRKHQRAHDEAAKFLQQWTECGAMTDADKQHARALQIANYCHLHLPRIAGDKEDFDQQPSAYTALKNDYPTLYAPRTLADVLQAAQRSYPRTMAHYARWVQHLGHRIAYERAMLGESGGLVAQKVDIEIGGRVLVRGQWLTVLRLNKKGGELVSVTTNSRYVAVRGLDEIAGYEAPSAEEAAATAAKMKAPKLCNYPGEGFKTITQADWDKCGSDYKSTTKRIAATATQGAHRVRTMLGVFAGVTGDDNQRHAYPFVYISDAKRIDPPAPVDNAPAPCPAPAVDNPEPAATTQAAPAADADYTAPRETSDTAPLHDTPRDLAPVVDADKVEAMRQALKNGGAVVAVAPQLFVTPPELAARMVELADLAPGALVLEPSAGTGNIIEPLRAAQCRTWAIEINAALATDLVQRHPLGHVVRADFLTWTPAPGVQFDAVVMNPPFVGGVDIQHITRAFGMLKPGGRLVAICAGGPRQARALQPLVEQHGGTWEPLPAGTFASSGTGVNTVLLTMTAPGRKEEPAPVDKVDPAQALAAPAAPDCTEARRSESTETSGLHDTPQDLAPTFQKMAPVAVDLGAVLAKGAPAQGLVGMGVQYLGDADNLPQEGAIVAAWLDAAAGVLVEVTTEDGAQHGPLLAQAFQGAGRWRLTLKMHGAPYLAQLATAQAMTTRGGTGGAIMPAMTYPEHMTGAELQTLREGCGLDRDEFAGLADVQARTVKHWENGRAGVPADVAQLARELDAACTQGAAAMLQRVQFEDVGAPEGQPVVLVRYKTPQDMPQGQNMPAGLQGAMVARVRLELLRKGLAVRVVWHDADQGDALAQLQAQALPHRGDQPAAH